MKLKMKRYVREFANDEMKDCTERRKLYIEKLLEHYERGYFTPFQTVELIVNSYYEYDIEL